ncbi:hypothetical protein A5634_12185 [Mycobacterium asiaticum]|uniref:DUF2330 domain-containing protein n=1 Tax=Mycobacterium asiaticum TaxID=1790 RepID=A0A1A3NFR3_MYCAS|nr:DUF2330 domain-containing protein [Mycobacterium asiaticum]OBK20631.1 hypothetical protein A5634_12185 [Mycobacterium asiaticum]
MAVRRLCRLGMFLAVLTGGLMLATPSHACACGAAIAPRGANAAVNHEVALVHWDGAIETIVMQLGMSASTDNVALVVPTPTPATVAAADEATFTELEQLSAPEIRHQRHWTLKSPLPGAADGAVRGAAPGARAPEVISQVQRPLEATTLAGGDLTGLQKWLADNGYAIKPTVLQALDPYVRDGWSFVALRLTSTAPIVGGLHPVRLTFQSPNLVYPMRLSVAAESPQHVTVFSLSDHRQQRTDADSSTQRIEVQFAGNVAGAAHDPLLRELTGNHGGYLTKTQVDINQTSRITSDFTFGNAPNDAPYRRVIVVDDDVAVPLGLVLAAGFAVMLIVAAVVLLVIRRRHRRRLRSSGSFG